MSIQGALVCHNENLYKEYIHTHRLNVQKAWDNMKNNSECLNYIQNSFNYASIDAIIECIDNCIKNHDLSKFSKEEFDAYRKNFYPISPEEKEENLVAFDKAWVHHYTNNMHHWNWWAETNNKNSMPLIYVIEMLCDWMSFSLKNPESTAYKWWMDNQDKMVMSDGTKKLVNKYIEYFKEPLKS